MNWYTDATKSKNTAGKMQNQIIGTVSIFNNDAFNTYVEILVASVLWYLFVSSSKYILFP